MVECKLHKDSVSFSSGSSEVSIVPGIYLGLGKLLQEKIFTIYPPKQLSIHAIKLEGSLRW